MRQPVPEAARIVATQGAMCVEHSRPKRGHSRTGQPTCSAVKSGSIQGPDQTLMVWS